MGQNKSYTIPVINEVGYQLPALSQCHEIKDNVNTFLHFFKSIEHVKCQNQEVFLLSFRLPTPPGSVRHGEAAEHQ